MARRGMFLFFLSFTKTALLNSPRCYIHGGYFDRAHQRRAAPSPARGCRFARVHRWMLGSACNTMPGNRRWFEVRVSPNVRSTARVLRPVSVRSFCTDGKQARSPECTCICVVTWSRQRTSGMNTTPRWKREGERVK